MVVSLPEGVLRIIMQDHPSLREGYVTCYPGNTTKIGAYQNLSLYRLYSVSQKLWYTD